MFGLGVAGVIGAATLSDVILYDVNINILFVRVFLQDFASGESANLVVNSSLGLGQLEYTH